MDSGNFLMIMPIILIFQLIKKVFSGTIRNLEDGYASVQSAIPLQCFPVNFADFLAEVFGSDDDKVITLGQDATHAEGKPRYTVRLSGKTTG